MKYIKEIQAAGQFLEQYPEHESEIITKLINDSVTNITAKYPDCRIMDLSFKFEKIDPNTNASKEVIETGMIITEVREELLKLRNTESIKFRIIVNIFRK